MSCVNELLNPTGFIRGLLTATDFHSNVFTLTTYVKEGNERKKYVQIGEP